MDKIQGLRGSGTVTIAGANVYRVASISTFSAMASNISYDEGERPNLSSVKMQINCRRAVNNATAGANRFAVFPVLVIYNGDIFTDGTESNGPDIRTILDDTIAGNFEYKVLGYHVAQRNAADTYWMIKLNIDLTRPMQVYVKKYMTNPAFKDNVNFRFVLIFYQWQTGDSFFEYFGELKYTIGQAPLTGAPIPVSGVSRAGGSQGITFWTPSRVAAHRLLTKENLRLLASDNGTAQKLAEWQNFFNAAQAAGFAPKDWRLPKRWR